MSSEANFFLTVYTGSNVTSLATIATNTAGLLSAQLTFDAVAGTEYQIALYGDNGYAEPTRLALFLDARELREPRLLPHGPFTFGLRTTVERLWIIEASTNLMNRAPVAAARSADGTLEFVVPSEATSPRRFYRAVAQPE